MMIPMQVVTRRRAFFTCAPLSKGSARRLMGAPGRSEALHLSLGTATTSFMPPAR